MKKNLFNLFNLIFLIFTTLLAIIGCSNPVVIETTTTTFSSNADLSSISLSNGTPLVKESELSYKANLPNDVESIKIIPVTKNSKAKIFVNGKSVQSGRESETFFLNAGEENIITITVISEDNRVQKNYIVKLKRLKTFSSNVNLSSISIPGITLSPSFNPSVTSYSAYVDNTVDNCNIIVIRGDQNQTLKINGSNYDSGTPKTISLTVGKNTINILVTAQDGSTGLYTIEIYRANPTQSNNANLSNITVSSGSLSPVFDKDNLNYLVSVDNSVSSVNVNATTEDSNATFVMKKGTVTINNPISLDVGNNTITIEVTAEDGIAKKNYTIVINRANPSQSNNANLSNLSCSGGVILPSFDSNVLSYSVSVGNAVSSTTVTATKEHAGATIKVNGQSVISGSPSQAIALSEGSNTITIEVTAEDGITKKVYTITVIRVSSGIRVHFKKVNQASGWTQVKVYYWGLDTSPSSSTWPGVNMELESGSWYIYTFNNTSKVHVIFNNGSSGGTNQTVDIMNITQETWFVPNGTGDQGMITCSATNQNPDGPTPLTVSATPGTSSFTTETINVTLSLSGDGITVSKYTLDGSDPATSPTAISFVDGTVIQIGSGMTVGQSKTLKLYATNGSQSDSKSYTYTKANVSSGLTVHFKRPAGWNNIPKIHYWNVVPTMPQTQWPGVAMTDEGNGWFVYTIPGATSASIVFNNDPSPQTGDLSRNKEGWYKNGVWTDSNPEGPQKVVVTANPQPGTYLTAQTVTLSSNNASGDIIYYTTNGTEPNSSSSQYSSPINVSSSMTIKAKGYNAGANPQWGDTYTFAYTIDPNADLIAPDIDVKSGYPLPGRWASAPGNVVFRITDNKSATTTAYYTTNGTEPTTSSSVYVFGDALNGLDGSAINVNGAMIIKFLVKDAAGNETRKTFSYIIGLGNDFREETIYFVITTRFYDGAPENNVHCWDDTYAGNPDSDPAWRGDFEGLTQKLDYIKALGFSAIWITPPVKNASGYDYHGYHAINFKEIDPRYRTSSKTAEQSYRDFINAAHAKGMKVIQDIVLNHSSNFGEENLYPLFRRNAPALNSVNESINTALTNIAPTGKLPDNYDSLTPARQYGARINAMKEDSIDTEHIYHHEKNLGWEDYTVQTAQIAGDCVDLNTENPTVSQYLREAYLQYISWGVDAFRVDTVKHISRLTFNREFIPQFTQAGGNYFYIFGETCARWRSSVWNFEKPCISPAFYTWKEEHPNYGGVNYPWSTRLERESSTLLHWNNNYSVNNEPESQNHLLSGNNYRPVDYTYRNRLDQIDFPMHWNFNNVNDAFNIALSGDKYYSDATWNVVYVDSHDYAPDGAPENKRYCGSWEEKLTLMFTFRGIPCLYYGSEIEFKKGMPIDVGPNAPLEQTGRAYFGTNITGTNPTVTDFGVWSGGSGSIVTTLNHPLAKHIQRLNQIRRKLPALQKGQYSREGVSGDLAFKRRYTDATVDNFVLVTINGGATFTGIPNGTYREVITGAQVTVSSGTLTASCSGNGNARIYVLLGTTGMTDPGKIGEDGAYLKP